MRKQAFIAASLLCVGLIGCSRSKPTPQLGQSTITVRNDADAHDVQVFWTATGCSAMDLVHRAADVCHQESIGGKKTASYTFRKGTSGRTVSLYRPGDYCALDSGSDLSDVSVSGNEALRTDGCVLEKDVSQSTMLRKTGP